MTESTALTRLDDAAREYIAASMSANTRRAYASDWQTFTSWCAEHDRPSMPATVETVALYLAAMAQDGRKASSIGRAAVSIGRAHQAAGHPSPVKSPAVAAVLGGIRRTHGTKATKKAALTTDLLRQVVALIPDDVAGLRDRALLLVGFAGAFRRSELVALQVEDIERAADGIVITVRQSKTDKTGEGQQLGIPYGSTVETCPVRALDRWMAAAGISSGPLFRAVSARGKVSGRSLCDRSVALIVQKYATLAGFDAATFGGHSLRSGLATSAAAAGVEERDIAAQTRHKSIAVLRGYVQRGSLFRRNAASGAGL